MSGEAAGRQRKPGVDWPAMLIFCGLSAKVWGHCFISNVWCYDQDGDQHCKCRLVCTVGRTTVSVESLCWCHVGPLRLLNSPLLCLYHTLYGPIGALSGVSPPVPISHSAWPQGCIIWVILSCACTTLCMAPGVHHLGSPFLCLYHTLHILQHICSSVTPHICSDCRMA